MGRVLFRVDGNNRIGLGHLLRCRALADILRAQHECVFATSASEASVLHAFAEAGYQVIRGNGSASWLTGELGRAGDTIVLDGYDFGEEYRREVKAAGYRVVCIDDLHQGRFDVDVVINHGGPASYDAPASTMICLGPSYALLRGPFLDVVQEPRVPRPLDSALICFGGSDPKNLTLSAFRALAQVSRLELVVGPAYAHLQELTQEVAGRAAIHRDATAEQLVGLIRKCGFALTSASTVAYEVCAVGAGLIVCPYVDNQRELASFLEASGAALLCADLSQTPPLTPALLTNQLRAQQRLFQGDVRANLRALFP